MHRYLQSYLDFIDGQLTRSDLSEEDLEKLKKEQLVQIQFMQHERLIHLIVTVLFAVMLFISLGILALSDKIIFAVLTVLILMPLIPYIWHYYFMENSVQKLYTQYNKMCTIQKGSQLEKIPAACISMDPTRIFNSGKIK